MGVAGVKQSPTLTFSVLGPLQVRLRGADVPIGGLKQRTVLAMLLINAGRIVSVERLIDGLWADDPPDGAVNTVQVYISHLRRALSDAVALHTQAPGYVLQVDREQLDLLRFEDLTQAAQSLARRRRLDDAVETYGRALELWSGTPLDDLGSNEFADSARTFLSERRLGAVDDRLTLLLELGRDQEVIEAARQVLADHPLREAVWEKLIVALYRSGRQADALATYRECREVLLEELGVEPAPQLRELEQQILHHDDRLQLPRRGSGRELVVPPGPTGLDSLSVGTETVMRPRRLDAEIQLPDGAVVPLTERMLLGRHRSCDIVVLEPSVSRRHAEIRMANGRHVLLDLSSSNGTWVNGAPVMQHPLADGDSFQLGDAELHYRTR